MSKKAGLWDKAEARNKAASKSWKCMCSSEQGTKGGRVPARVEQGVGALRVALKSAVNEAT